MNGSAAGHHQPHDVARGLWCMVEIGMTVSHSHGTHIIPDSCFVRQNCYGENGA